MDPGEPRTTAFAGQGLHSGQPATLRMRVHEDGADAPVTLVVGDVSCALGAWKVSDTTRSTSITARRSTGSLERAVRLRTVEHVLAALAGLGIHRGVILSVEGGEVPLMDGGARVFAEGLRGLAVAASAPSLVIVRTGEVAVGQSRYSFTPGEQLRVEVSVDFGDARLSSVASWAGDPEDFATRIAPARTFGFEREIAPLMEQGLASHVSPESVVVVGDDVIHAAGPAFQADEPARHKLLDLLGDLYLHGGPPRGQVRAHRPGHAATHEAVRRAMAAGLLALSVG